MSVIDQGRAEGERAGGNADAGRSDTATLVLDAAEALAQVRGFNGFSYADIATELGVTKAALHYHFASKADLGEALVVRYSERFAEALAAIDGRMVGAVDKLDAYAQVYADVLRQHRMCLCGMLAAEFDTLPPAMQEAVVRFFEQNEVWLAGVLERGRDEGSLAFSGAPIDVARTVVSSLEGAMLVARTFGDPERFRGVAVQLVDGLKRRGLVGSGS